MSNIIYPKKPITLKNKTTNCIKVIKLIKHNFHLYMQFQANKQSTYKPKFSWGFSIIARCQFGVSLQKTIHYTYLLLYFREKLKCISTCNDNLVILWHSEKNEILKPSAIHTTRNILKYGWKKSRIYIKFLSLLIQPD